MNIALWIVQAVLAVLFVFAGSMKFMMSVEEMTKQMPMPVWFLHCIGVAEILGEPVEAVLGYASHADLIAARDFAVLETHNLTWDPPEEDRERSIAG